MSVQDERSLGFPPRDAVQGNQPLQSQVGGLHYKGLAIEPVEFIHRNNLNFLEGNVVKRMCRHGRKDGVMDLRKAIHEIELLIALQYGEQKGGVK